MTSVGTIGHPFNCALACKYARKPKGCKDGSSCSRCHECEWNRHCEKRASNRSVKMLSSGFARDASDRRCGPPGIFFVDN
mmetsp:Transcript_53379/g.135422  ORF Transcript_53379/g.135422 Transcript_53379/m.135422 type:complete len:80 (+) Transcript_53379:125-364(+)